MDGCLCRLIVKVSHMPPKILARLRTAHHVSMVYFTRDLPHDRAGPLGHFLNSELFDREMLQRAATLTTHDAHTRAGVRRVINYTGLTGDELGQLLDSNRLS